MITLNAESFCVSKSRLDYATFQGCFVQTQADVYILYALFVDSQYPFKLK